MLAAEVFCLAAKLAEKDGVTPLSRLPGPWERRLDKSWTIVLNGHGTPREYKGMTVPPFQMYVEYNGWPAGLLSPSGGVIAAGESANEHALVEPLKKALAS